MTGTSASAARAERSTSRPEPLWHAQVSEDEPVTRSSDFVERRAGVNRFRYAVSGIFES